MKKLSRLAPLLAVLALAGCGQSSSVNHIASATPSQSAMGSVAPPNWGTGTTPPALNLAPSTATAEMLDGISVGDFHGLRPFAIAGYTAGFWPDFLALHATFPASHAISVAISARYRADCLDVEPGDASPSQAGTWARADIAAGFPHPCLYADLSEMPSVRASLAVAGLARSQYFLWLAWYRFTPGLVSGYDAVQWTDKALGRNLDESTVTLAFLSIAQPPYVTPKHKPAPKPVIVRRASAEVQLSSGLTGTVTVRVSHGHWTISKGGRVHSLPFNAPPLGQ